jgi:hypothetical protein
MNLEKFKKLDDILDNMIDKELLKYFPSCKIAETHYTGELWDADPQCKHVLDEECHSGIRCIKCGGWYCL